MKIKSCYLTASQVHLVTKSDMLCLHSEHTEIFAEGIFLLLLICIIRRFLFLLVENQA